MELDERQALAWVSKDEPLSKTHFRAGMATPMITDQSLFELQEKKYINGMGEINSPYVITETGREALKNAGDKEGLRNMLLFLGGVIFVAAIIIVTIVG